MVQDDNFFCQMITDNTQLITNCVMDYVQWADNHAKLSYSMVWDQQKDEIKKEYTNYLEYHHQYCSENRDDKTIPIDRFVATTNYFGIIKKIDDLTGYTNWRISSTSNYSKIQTDFLEELEIDKVMEYTRDVFARLMQYVKGIVKNGGNWNSIEEQEDFITELTEMNDTLVKMTRRYLRHPGEYNVESFIAFVPNRIKEINEILTREGYSSLSIPSFFLVYVKEPPGPRYSSLPNIMYASTMSSSNFIISRPDEVAFNHYWGNYIVEIANLANALIFELKDSTDSQDITNLPFLKENNKSITDFMNKTSLSVLGRASFAPEVLNRSLCIGNLLSYIHKIDMGYSPDEWRDNFDYDKMLKELQKGIGIRHNYILAYTTFKRIVETFDKKCTSKDTEFIKKRDYFKNTIIKNASDSLRNHDDAVDQDYTTETGANYLTTISILYDKINDFYKKWKITKDDIPLDPIFLLINYEDDDDDSGDDSEEDNSDDDDMEMDKDHTTDDM